MCDLPSTLVQVMHSQGLQLTSIAATVSVTETEVGRLSDLRRRILDKQLIPPTHVRMQGQIILLCPDGSTQLKRRGALLDVNPSPMLALSIVRPCNICTRVHMDTCTHTHKHTRACMYASTGVHDDGGAGLLGPYAGSAEVSLGRHRTRRKRLDDALLTRLLCCYRNWPRACVRACMRAMVRACVRAYGLVLRYAIMH